MTKSAKTTAGSVNSPAAGWRKVALKSGEMRMAETANIVVLAKTDNVGIAVRDLQTNETARSVVGRSIRAREAIPLGHKIALRSIEAGEKIVRFAVPVGIATEEIAAGALVHVHNVKSQYLDNVEDHYE